MSHRDKFPKVKNGLFINGVFVEDLNGFYYNNENVGIPDGCYADGEVLSQFGSALFIPGIEFTAHGLVSSGVWEGASTMHLGVSFSTYGETEDPDSALYPRIITAPLSLTVEFDKIKDDGYGGETSWSADMKVNIGMEGV